MSATENNSAEYLDPKEFYANELDDWKKIWDSSKNFYQNIESIVDNSVFFPARDIVLPVVSSYICVPSKWAKILGVLLCYGKEGSGKSTVSHIACKVHGLTQTFSATDTFASIRNSLNNMRWLTEDRQQEKEGVILCWDNIHSSTLSENKHIYQMLLFGYNRASEKISIANNDGTNRDFYVFSPKILSTIDAIHLNPDFSELKRRLYLIPHKPYKNFLPKDKENYKDRNIEDRIDLDSINWDGMDEKFHLFWNSRENVQNYAKLRTALTRKNSKLSKNLPISMTSERWTISIDLIVTGVVTGKWLDVRDAIAHMGEYWKYVDSEMSEGSATVSHIESFINEQVGWELETNQKLVESGMRANEVFISPSKLKERIAFHQTRGELDCNPDTKKITQIMNQLGWKLTTKGWKQI